MYIQRRQRILLSMFLLSFHTIILLLVLLESLNHGTNASARQRVAALRNQETSRNHMEPRQRLVWSTFINLLSDTQFRRMFRMSKECFNLLCKKIIATVGEENFKSESYIDSYLNNEPLYKAHKEKSGGYICGEVKLAITLRMLAGGSYLDLSLIFHCNDKYVYSIFHDVLKEWICDSIKIPNEEYFRDIEAMKVTAQEFASGRNNGILSGCIGALDGWLVKIKKPSQKKDRVRNVAGYFSRKGFYAVNCQVIVDKKKRILWRSIKCRGGEHDSAAFKRTGLYEQLLEDFPILLQHGLYIIGDSAYSLCSFLLKPFENSTPYSDEDSFNFFLSSARIAVECCFGEIDGRWGIFWKPLGFSLQKNLIVIDAAMRLHNFIVDFREKTKENPEVLQREMDMFDRETVATMREDEDNEHYFIVGVQNDCTPPPPSDVGRPSNTEIRIRNEGIIRRKYLCDLFAENKMKRPDRHGTSLFYEQGQFGRLRETSSSSTN